MKEADLSFIYLLSIHRVLFIVGSDSTALHTFLACYIVSNVLINYD